MRYLSFFRTEHLVCNSPAACRAMLQTHCDAIPKSRWWTRATRSIVGRGLLGQAGAEHRAHRRMLAAPFARASVARLHPLFTAKAAQLSAVVGRAVERGADGGRTGVVDCSELFMKAFLDIIGVAVLGKELANLPTVGFDDDDDDEAQPKAQDEDGHEHPYHKAFAEFFAPPTKLKQILIFASGFFPVIRWLPLQANRDFNSAMTALHAVVQSLIEERTAELKSTSLDGAREKKNSSTDLLTFILQESLPGGSAEGMPPDILKDHVSGTLSRHTEHRACMPVRCKPTTR